jgi:hypothetical protein
MKKLVRPLPKPHELGLPRCPVCNTAVRTISRLIAVWWKEQGGEGWGAKAGCAVDARHALEGKP